MKKWKVAFFVALFVGLASNAYLFYHLIDSVISYSYLHYSHDAESRRFKALSDLMVAGSDDCTKADILHLLRPSRKDAFIVDEEDAIHFEGINLVFENDKLVNVE